MAAGCSVGTELVRVYGGYAQRAQRLSGVDRGVRGFRSFSAGDVT